jgi:hypothetical protein
MTAEVASVGHRKAQLFGDPTEPVNQRRKKQLVRSLVAKASVSFGHWHSPL